jgi:F-type H+-transporting ATPase subunit epsilon
MAAHIALEIVTPEGVKLEEQVADLTAPSVEGEFGVLPGHRPLMAALAAGLVRYHVGSDEHVVAVGPGFVELHGDRATIITDKFLKKGEVDPVVARLELKEADEALEKYVGEPGSADHRALVDREAWAAVQLELYGDPPPPKVRLGEFHVAQDVGVPEGADVLAATNDSDQH